MGLPMCKNLVRAGYEVSALDLRAEAYMHSATSAEVLSLGAKAGVSLDTLHGALTSCAPNSQCLERDFPSVFLGGYGLSFSLALVRKDLGLAVDLGRRTGAPLVVAALVEQLHHKVHALDGNAGPEGELTYAA